MREGKVPYYKFVAYNSGFGNNKTAIFDKFILNQGFRYSEHTEHININTIPLDDLLILKKFLDDNEGFYNTIRRAVDKELETENRKQQLKNLSDKQQRIYKDLENSKREKSNFYSEINAIVQDNDENQKRKLLTRLKDTLKKYCKISENIIDSIDFRQILNEYSEYVAGLAIRNGYLNSELDKLYKNFSINIEDILIEKFCNKNSYHICINIYKKTRIQDEINLIKKFLIDRVTNYFYDDPEIVYRDVDFDEEATNIFSEYGSLEKYIETLYSKNCNSENCNSENCTDPLYSISTENKSFNSIIFNRITKKARETKKGKQKRSLPSLSNYLIQDQAWRIDLNALSKKSS
jgi:hypothetical protein